MVAAPLVGIEEVCAHPIPAAVLQAARHETVDSRAEGSLQRQVSTESEPEGRTGPDRTGSRL